MNLKAKTKKVDQFYSRDADKLYIFLFLTNPMDYFAKAQILCHSIIGSPYVF